MAIPAMQVSEKQAAGYFWKVMELNEVAMVIWRSDGKYIQANDAFLQLVGYSREDCEKGNLDWQRMTAPDSREANRRAVEELKTKTVAQPFEKTYIRKDGSKIRVRIHLAVLQPGDEQGVSIITPLHE